MQPSQVLGHGRWPCWLLGWSPWEENRGHTVLIQHTVINLRHFRVKLYFDLYLLELKIHLFYKSLLSTYHVLITVLESGYVVVNSKETAPPSLKAKSSEAAALVRKEDHTHTHTHTHMPNTRLPEGGSDVEAVSEQGGSIWGSCSGEESSEERLEAGDAAAPWRCTWLGVRAGQPSRGKEQETQRAQRGEEAKVTREDDGRPGVASGQGPDHGGGLVSKFRFY